MILLTTEFFNVNLTITQEQHPIFNDHGKGRYRSDTLMTMRRTSLMKARVRSMLSIVVRITSGLQRNDYLISVSFRWMLMIQ